MKKTVILGFYILLRGIFVPPGFAQTASSVIIDMKLNVLAPDPAGNYLRWSAGTFSIIDSLDAFTGVCKYQSTTKFDIVRYDGPSTKEATIPEGFRILLMYPVSTFSLITDDNLRVSANGSRITIRYVHQGTAYEIRTDAGGRLNILTGCRRAEGFASEVRDNRYILRKGYTLSGGNQGDMASLDWSRISLEPDTYSPAASRRYEGMVDVRFTNGILTVRGIITERTEKKGSTAI